MSMSRGFEKISSQTSNPNVSIPQRKTKHSVGYDISIPTDLSIPAQSTVKVAIGVKAFFQEDEVMYIFPRSSLAIKKNITLANGVAVFESDYYNNPDNEGEIILALKNSGDKEVSLAQGERVAQCVFHKVLFVDTEVTPQQTRLGGIGSTGK